MKWSDELATGVVEIDKQHQTLFTWFNELESAAAEERLMATTYALNRLTQYTISHFVDEEKLMAECKYPQLAEHKAEHDAFRAQLRDLQLRAEEIDISDATVGFLRDWLVRHIMTVDMDYAPWARGE
jgi:hemerythrin